MRAYLPIARVCPFLFTAIKNSSQGGDQLAKAKYSFKKHQKELARKQKKEQKRQRKLDKDIVKSDEENPDSPQDEVENQQI